MRLLRTRSDIRSQHAAGEKVLRTAIVYSPVTGIAADLSTAPDEGFAEGMMGEGAVVTPKDPVICAPEDGEVEFIFDTKACHQFRQIQIFLCSSISALTL